MTAPEQDLLGSEQLDVFLHEIGVLSSSQPHDELAEEESSLDNLLDEILELTEVPPSSPPAPSFSTFPLEKEQKRRSYSVIWITTALLFGLLAGSAFGFFWGRGQVQQVDTPIIKPQEEITLQISSWIKDLRELCQLLEPKGTSL